jgi:glycosyltransferase involved in cell wall biosynthesis
MTKFNPKDQTKIRVLLAGHLPPPAGGIATYFQSLLNSSLPERVHLSFVQTSSHNRVLSQTGRMSLLNLFAAFQDCIRFFRSVLVHRPQICHIGTAFGLSFLKHSVCVLFARILGCQVLLHPHCSFSAIYSDRPAWWRWWFRRIINLTAGVIIISSEWKHLADIVPKSRVYFLQNAIDLSEYQKIAQDRLLNPKMNGDVHILYLGYIGRDKGSYDLLGTAERFSWDHFRASIDLIGSELAPGELERLRQQIERDQLTEIVRLHQPVYDEAKLDFFGKADIFVYPSYHEGMPMAIIEAMACGLPVVGTRVGGIPDLIQDGVNGILVDPASPDQLAEALIKIASDPQLSFSMQKNGAKIANERYDIKQHVAKLVEIYAQSI